MQVYSEMTEDGIADVIMAAATFFRKIDLKPLHLLLHTSAATSVKYTKVTELSN